MSNPPLRQWPVSGKQDEWKKRAAEKPSPRPPRVLSEDGPSSVPRTSHKTSPPQKPTAGSPPEPCSQAQPGAQMQSRTFFGRVFGTSGEQSLKQQPISGDQREKLETPTFLQMLNPFADKKKEQKVVETANEDQKEPKKETNDEQPIKMVEPDEERRLLSPEPYDDPTPSKAPTFNAATSAPRPSASKIPSIVVTEHDEQTQPPERKGEPGFQDKLFKTTEKSTPGDTGQSQSKNEPKKEENFLTKIFSSSSERKLEESKTQEAPVPSLAPATCLTGQNAKSGEAGLLSKIFAPTDIGKEASPAAFESTLASKREEPGFFNKFFGSMDEKKSTAALTPQAGLPSNGGSPLTFSTPLPVGSGGEAKEKTLKEKAWNAVKKNEPLERTVAVFQSELRERDDKISHLEKGLEELRAERDTLAAARLDERNARESEIKQGHVYFGQLEQLVKLIETQYGLEPADESTQVDEHSTGILDAFQQCRLREQENLLKRLERLLVTTQDAAQVLIANAENARRERHMFVETQTDFDANDIEYEYLLGLQYEALGVTATKQSTVDEALASEAGERAFDELDTMISHKSGTLATSRPDAEWIQAACKQLESLSACGADRSQLRRWSSDRAEADADWCDAEVQTAVVGEAGFLQTLELELLRYRRLMQALEFVLADSPERDAGAGDGGARDGGASDSVVLENVANPSENVFSGKRAVESRSLPFRRLHGRVSRSHCSTRLKDNENKDYEDSFDDVEFQAAIAVIPIAPTLPQTAGKKPSYGYPDLRELSQSAQKQGTRLEAESSRKLERTSTDRPVSRAPGWEGDGQLLAGPPREPLATDEGVHNLYRLHISDLEVELDELSQTSIEDRAQLHALALQLGSSKQLTDHLMSKLDTCLRSNERIKGREHFLRLRVEELIARGDRASSACAAWRERAENGRSRLVKIQLLVRNFELAAPESLHASLEEASCGSRTKKYNEDDPTAV